MSVEYQFVLVEPARAEHVGSIARALKTLGFDALSLVNSAAHLEERARWAAHGSREILEQALVFPTIEEAVKDADFIVATTTRKRTIKHEYHTAAELRNLLQQKQGIIRRVALLFGREESGLTNAELGVSHCVSCIPLAVDYPSLNLAQAVLLYAYELSPIQRELGAPSPEELSDKSEDLSYRAVRERVENIFQSIGFAGEHLVGKRLLERLALLSSSDIRLIHSLCAKLEMGLSISGRGKE